MLSQVIKGSTVMIVAMDYQVLKAHQANKVFQVYNIIQSTVTNVYNSAMIDDGIYLL